MKFFAQKKECPEAAAIRYRLQHAAKKDKAHFESLLRAHKATCRECSGKK